MANIVPVDSTAMDRDPVGNSNSDVVARARRRFRRQVEWESVARSRWVEDIKFAHGDTDNGYQWPGTIRQSRNQNSRPCLTMNIVRQHNLQVINSGKQNKSAITIKPVGNGATVESAKVLDALVQHIQYRSDAQAAYSLAREFQVDAGLGWLRLVTEWASQDSFDQEVFIRGVWDPLAVYVDLDAKEPGKLDARFGFCFDLVPRDEFREAYPEFADRVGNSPLGEGLSWTWNDADHLMVLEYFEIQLVPDELYSFIGEGDTERTLLRKSAMPPEVLAAVRDLPLTRVRTIHDRKIMWYLIVGQEIIDSTEWPGQYIPLIPVEGEVTVIDGILDRKGLTRSLKDAQRMFNYNASAAVEFGALQSKSPYIGAAAAIEEFQQYWDSANTVNHSVLPYNHKDDEGNPLPPPTRQEPPSNAPAFADGMRTAFEQMMMTSGQWQNQMGMGGNERTGEAIQQRQAQGDTATYHFQDSFNQALVTVGRQLVDLFPRVYDTRRVMMIQAQDGADIEVTLDPTAAKAFQQRVAYDGSVVERTLNLTIGKYSVVAAVGPAYGTRREQTVQAMTLLLTQAPGLAGLIGDLLLSAMDFPAAQEAGLRLKRMVPPQALGNGPSAEMQQAQQQIAALQTALAEALQQSGKDRLKLVGKAQMRDIDVYKAETDRMKALADMLPTDPEGLKRLVDQLVQTSLKTSLQPVIDANADDIDVDGQAPSDGADAPPVPGARRAPDGEWYLSDPTRKGRYLRIAPLAQERSPRGVIANA